jgi:hypothetical protein
MRETRETRGRRGRRGINKKCPMPNAQCPRDDFSVKALRREI